MSASAEVRVRTVFKQQADQRGIALVRRSGPMQGRVTRAVVSLVYTGAAFQQKAHSGCVITPGRLLECRAGKAFAVDVRPSVQEHFHQPVVAAISRPHQGAAATTEKERSYLHARLSIGVRAAPQ